MKPHQIAPEMQKIMYRQCVVRDRMRICAIFQNDLYPLHNIPERRKSSRMMVLTSELRYCIRTSR